MLDALPTQYAIRGAWGRLWPDQSNDQIRTAGHAAHGSPTYGLNSKNI
ncbi:MAG TPA: hypothetical protein VF772_15695 [Terriglobales bacterium]